MEDRHYPTFDNDEEREPTLEDNLSRVALSQKATVSSSLASAPHGYSIRTDADRIIRETLAARPAPAENRKVQP
jgi:hypothetical protein